MQQRGQNGVTGLRPRRRAAVNVSTGGGASTRRCERQRCRSPRMRKRRRLLASQAATIIADDSDSQSGNCVVCIGGRRGKPLCRARWPMVRSRAALPCRLLRLLPVLRPRQAHVASAAKHDKSPAIASKSKHEAGAHGKKESATASAGGHRSSTTTAAAQSKKAKPDAASKDDSDADLLAALVRTHQTRR